MKCRSNSSNKAVKQMVKIGSRSKIKWQLTGIGSWPVFRETKIKIDWKKIKMVKLKVQLYFWKQMLSKVMTDIDFYLKEMD